MPRVDTASVSTIKDPRERARAANKLIDELQGTVNELSDVRRDALRELLASGMSQTAIAELLGMSKSRISQLLSAGTRPERTFLGTGKLTVAIGGKLETDKKQPGGVVSAEAFSAYETLADLARAVGLDATYEVVPPPGHVDLNRPNLIVLTNPRLLPFLSQVMGADPHLRYLHDDDGWYLVDISTETEYRSPMDEGKAIDYGYVGRLPRPDGKGTFLYLAGTHAPGTLGAAHYVADNITGLHRELKNRRFSTIVACHYDPKDRKKILRTEPVTPVYRHEGS
jgi:Helix-turn-helix